MTDTTPTFSVEGDGFVSGGDSSQYVNDPFGGGDTDILTALSEQIEETTSDPDTTTEEPTEDSETGQEPDSTEDTEETQEEEDDAPVEEEAEEEVADTKDEVQAKTTYKVKIDGKEIDVPDNAVFKIKVDGKTQHVTLADLTSDFNGRTVWASKFSELGRERAALQQREQSIVKGVERIKGHLEKAGKALEAKNPLRAVLEISKAQGLNSKEQVANFLVQADAALGDWTKMQPAERQLLLDQIELEQLRSADEEKRTEIEIQQRNKSILDETESMILAEGFTVQDYVDASKWLIENAPEKFSQNDDIHNRQIVLDTLRQSNQYLEIEGAALKVNPQKYNSLKADVKRELTSKLMKLRSIGEWNSQAELQELLVELLGKPNVQSKTSLASPKAANTAAKPSAPKGSLNNKNPAASQIDSILKQVMESDI